MFPFYWDGCKQLGDEVDLFQFNPTYEVVLSIKKDLVGLAWTKVATVLVVRPWAISDPDRPNVKSFMLNLMILFNSASETSVRAV